MCDLGEGPFWHEEQLWWVDIERGQLRAADIDGNLTQSVEFGRRIGAAAPLVDGTFLIALEREIIHARPDGTGRKKVAAPSDLPKGSRFNDGKCDPMGRWIIGTTSHGPATTSSLYSLHGDRSLHCLRGGIAISNGLAWSADGRTMYYIDTMALCVTAYDYDLEQGILSQKRIVLRFSENEGWPDGMTIDREGRLWIGFWDGWTVRCYRPETGQCEVVIRVPCARPTSCCFGGADLKRLYITTARHGLNDDALQEQPLAGSLFICDLETAGYPTCLFNNAP